MSIVDKAGKPLAGAEVSMNVWVGGTSDTVEMKKTDEHGKASFSGVLKRGRYSFGVSYVGYDQFGDSGNGIESGSAKWKPTRKIVMTKSDQVKGTVVDSEGKPVVGATVTRSGYDEARTTTTDAQGAFKLFLAPKGQDDGIPVSPAVGRDSTPAKEKIKLKAEDSAHSVGVQVSVDRATAVAKGVQLAVKPAYELQVIVKDTSDKPVAGATVTDMGSGMSWFDDRNEYTTDAQGIARLSLYEGMSTTAVAEMKGYAYIGYPQSSPAPESKAWTGKCELVLTPLTRKVEGKVLDGAGKPVKGANISMSFATDVSVTSDAEGRFTIDLPDTMVPLSASTDNGQGSTNVGRDDKTVTITINER